jgi:precorrin-3B methylase
MTNETITDTLLAADDSSLLLVLSNSSGDLTVYTVALPSAATLASPPASGLALQPVPVPSAATKAAANAFAPVGYAQDPVFPISWKN